MGTVRQSAYTPAISVHREPSTEVRRQNAVRKVVIKIKELGVRLFRKRERM